MDWEKKEIHNFDGNHRYEYVKEPEGYTIDVRIGKEQGMPGSNQVVILGGNKYGGYLLGTPKSFKTTTEAEAFAKLAMNKLNKGELGKKVPFNA